MGLYLSGAVVIYSNPILPESGLKFGQLGHPNGSQPSLNLQAPLDPSITEFAQPIIIYFLHIGVPQSFKTSHGAGVRGKGRSCLSIGVASTFSTLAFSKLSSLPSLNCDNIWGSEVWGFFFWGLLGGVSFRVDTFFPLAYLWSLSLTFSFIGNSTRSLLLLDNSVESELKTSVFCFPSFLLVLRMNHLLVAWYLCTNTH